MRPHERRIGRLLVAAGCVVAGAFAVLLVRRRQARLRRAIAHRRAPLALPAAPVLRALPAAPVARPAPSAEEAVTAHPAPNEPELAPAGGPPAHAPRRRHRRPRRPRTAQQRRQLAVQIVDGLVIFVATTVMWLAVYAFAPHLLGWQPRSVVSGSMSPSIRPGDVVVVRPGLAALAPGTLVTFNDPAQPGRVLTHRIVRLNDDGTWTTKGDANPQADTTPLDPDDVIGQPRLVVPLIGLPAYWRASGGVPLSAIISAAVAVSLAAARVAVRRMRPGVEPEPVTSARLPAQRDRPGAAEGSPAEEEPWESASASS